MAARKADEELTRTNPQLAAWVHIRRGLESPDGEKYLADLREKGTPAALFLIGGADGLAAEIRQGADFVLAFGAATFPHQLVRILLAEQIYRALTILSGHPYHRG